MMLPCVRFHADIAALHCIASHRVLNCGEMIDGWMYQVWIRGRVHQVRGKGGSAFLVVRQDTVSTVQAVHFKDKENVEESKRWDISPEHQTSTFLPQDKNTR